MSQCTPANKPQLIEVTDLIFSPADFERRFLTGWWTRGVIPADNFTETNWAGLIIPSKITFDENEIFIEYPGRWWQDEGQCPSSMPKIKIHIQYICKGGRLYLHSDVHYGNKITRQTYAGHNGASKFSRIPLEKIEEDCSIEKTANIPIEKADKIELKHLADWLVTMYSAPGVTIVGLPNLDWTTLFADYTESDFSWAPCVGCLFPTQNYSIPEIQSEDNMLQLEARLALQAVKALGDILIIGTIPEAFSVPLCAHNTYLEVSLPSLSGIVHMRTFFDSCFQYFTDEYTSIPVNSSDVLKCFQIPKTDDWPKSDDPRWVPLCEPNITEKCILSIGYSLLNGTDDRTPRGGQSLQDLSAPMCSGSYSEPTYIPGKWPLGGNQQKVCLVALQIITKEWNQISCRRIQGYSGDREEVGCTRLQSQKVTVLWNKDIPSGDLNSEYYKLTNLNKNWQCGDPFNSGEGQSGGGSPPPTNEPPERTQDKGDCFFEATYIYQININTALGRIFYEVSKPIRVKVPKGTVNLGPVSATLNGTQLIMSTPIGGSITVDLNGVFSYFSALGNAIASIIPVTGGVRNPRIICP